MSAFEGLRARQVRIVRAAVGLVGGAAAGVLLANGRYAAGAGLAVAALVGTVVLPRLASGPVSDERTDARERWASAAAMRVACCAYLGAVVVGSVGVAVGEVVLTGEAVGAFFGVGAVFLVYMLALGYAHVAGKP